MRNGAGEARKKRLEVARMLIYCVECEAGNAEDAELCSMCGHALKGPATKRRSDGATEEKPVSGRKRRPVMLATSVIVFVVGIVLLVATIRAVIEAKEKTVREVAAFESAGREERQAAAKTAASEPVPQYAESTEEDAREEAERRLLEMFQRIQAAVEKAADRRERTPAITAEQSREATGHLVAIAVQLVEIDDSTMVGVVGATAGQGLTRDQIADIAILQHTGKFTVEETAPGRLTVRAGLDAARREADFIRGWREREALQRPVGR